ncbi:MAG: RHS repeat protein [Rhodospirillales bacterium]|nr:RHS repeat protein [Rhodospirillales bacterium]
MGRKTTYAYDRLGRRISATNSAIQAAPLVQQTFTKNGQRASLTDANGYTDCEASDKPTCFAYDGFDRLATTTYPDSSTEFLTYDADGNVVARRTRAGVTVGYTYDTLNRLITKTVPSSPTVTYTYDLAGRQTSVSDTGPAIAPAVAPGGGTVAYTTTYTYDRLNRPTAVSFDPAPTAASPAAGSVVTFGHTYNKANQRTGETTTDSTWIGYPAASGSTTAYTANNLNQYTTVGAVTPTYDGNGNLTSDGTYSLGYDVENRLVSASGAGNTSSYSFDGRGRRKARTVNGTTTISVTDADNREVLEYDGSTGTLLRWYAYGLGPNAVVSQLNLAASTRNTLIPNLLGSIVGSYDSTGALTKFGYQPYGGGTEVDPEIRTRGVVGEEAVPY